MKTSANGAANLEPSTHGVDFAQRVHVDQAKLTSELRPHCDFIVCGSGSSGSVVARRAGARTTGTISRRKRAIPLPASLFGERAGEILKADHKL